MDKKDKRCRLQIEKGLELHAKLYQEFQEKLKDPKYAEAYKLSEEDLELYFYKKVTTLRKLLI